jgi:hypothetical protein
VPRKIILAAALLLTMAAAASAETCPLVDQGIKTPTITVSGRITMRHHIPKGYETRAAGGPYLVLDKPLLVDTGFGCWKWRKIVIMTDTDNQFRANQRVTIKGTLDQFYNSLVEPSINITPTTVKKKR